MPRYRARLGGIEGSGVYQSPSGAIDFGGIIQALGSQATSLIQGAYARKLAQKNAEAAAAQIERQNAIQDRQLAGQEEDRRHRIDTQALKEAARVRERMEDQERADAKEARDREERERDRAAAQAAKAREDEHHATHDVETRRHNRVMEGAAPWTVVQGTDPNTGAPSIIRINKQSGEFDVNPGAGKAPAGAQGMATLKKAVAANDAQLLVIADALRELEQYPDAVGLTRVAGDAVNQRVDPRGVAARAALANIGSMVFHDRSGAAVTVSEAKRLTPFIPSVTDKPEVATEKLAGLAKAIRDEQNALRAHLSTPQRGAGPAGMPRIRMPGGTGPGAPSEAQALWDAAVARHGRAKVLEEFGPRPPR